MQSKETRDERPSMRMIAERTGVSTVTVHRALTGSGPVAKETRARIMAVAREIGYRPNRLARSLQRGYSASIGVVVAGLATSFHASLLDGITSQAQTLGYDVLIQNSGRRPEIERRCCELLLQRAVEGLVVHPADADTNTEYLRELSEAQIPIVLVDSQVSDLDVDCVTSDNALGGYLAANHLISLGRARITLVGSRPASAWGANLRERMDGCNRALLEAGLPAVSVSFPETSAAIGHERSGYESATAALRADPRPDGVIAFSDSSAQGAVCAMRDAGLRVPEDVAVVGYNDESFSAYTRPRFTTVRQRPDRLGAEAARLVISRCRQEATGGTRTMVFEPSLW